MTKPRRDYGPVQLTDWLRQFYDHANVFRARDLGLLPQPDRGGGKRWSAALAEDIRARWPEIAAASECAGAPRLKERGWTESMIRDLLGQPDLTVPNPYYRCAGEMRLWRLQRVQEVEATPEFTQRRERAERQCEAAARGADTKRVWKWMTRP